MDLNKIAFYLVLSLVGVFLFTILLVALYSEMKDKKSKKTLNKQQSTPINNAYRYRGLINVVCLVATIIFLFSYWIIKKELTLVILGTSMIVGQIITLIEKRMTPENEWRKRQAKYDERYHIITGKAAHITYWITMLSLGGVILWIAWQENEAYEIFLLVLSIIFMIHIFSFYIVRAILNRHK